MTAKKKQTKTENKQETETRLNINSHINHIKSFRSRLAQPETELHTELSISMNVARNFCLRHTIKLNTDWVLNMTRHSFTMSVDDVLNNFINRRVCIESDDRFSHIKWASVQSNSKIVGTHFVDIKCNIVSSLAMRKTLLNSEFTARKKDFFYSE